MVEAGLVTAIISPNENLITKRLPNLFHINSRKLIKFWIDYIEDRPQITDEEEKYMLCMLYYSFYQAEPKKEGFKTIVEGINDIIQSNETKEEILEILQFNYNKIDHIETENEFSFPCPLSVHSRYSTAQRYIHHREKGNKIALFVREYRKENGYTAPFVYLGTCEYVSHSGYKPMSFIWRLKEEMPPQFFHKANKSIL